MCDNLTLCGLTAMMPAACQSSLFTGVFMPQSLAVGAITGLIACLLLAVLLYTRRRGIADPAKFNAWHGVSVVASIPHTDSTEALLGSDDLAYQGIRSLATAVDLMTLDNEAVTISLTGIGTGPDAGFVAANLAATLPRPVLLVDADAQAGQLHERFGVPASPGLTDVLTDSTAMDAAINAALHEPAPGLHFLARGSTGAAPTPEALDGFAASCQDNWPVVVLTTPSAAHAAQAAAITRGRTVAYLVAACGRHSQGALDAAIDAMARHGAGSKGLVFNGQAMPAADYEVVTE